MTTPEQIFVKAMLAIALLALLVLAAHQDLRENRISNALTLAGFAGAVLLRTLLEGNPGFMAALAGAGIGLSCFLPLYVCKGVGAGDVKLMAAAGAYLGPADAFIASLLSLAAGAVLAVLIVVWRIHENRGASAGLAVVAHGGGEPNPAQPPLRKQKFPYALAIAAGVVMTMWLRGMLEVFIP